MLLVVILFNYQYIIAQQSQNNLSASIGLGLPFAPNIYSTAAINSTVEYLRMINLKDGVAFQIDFIEFRSKTRPVNAEIRSFRFGYRRRFTEKFYSQISPGASMISGASGTQLSASAELRTGFLFPLKDYYSVDISCFISPTTKELGWVGLKLGLMYSFKKKNKKLQNQ
jgi:hypothetical protein